MLDSQKSHPKVGEPVVNFILRLGVDGIEHHFLDLVPVVPGLLYSGPVVVAFIEVVPVHLVHSHCEHLLVFRIHPLLDDPMIQEFVHVDAGSVSEVENQRMPQGLGTDVVCLLIPQNLEEFLVDGIGVEEIFPDLSFEVGVVLDKDSLAAEVLPHCFWSCLKMHYPVVFSDYNLPNCLTKICRQEYNSLDQD